MTKFAYIADTHLGAEGAGFQQQQRYPERLPEILAALRRYLASENDIDFVLHGGDMIDKTTDDNIRNAAKLFRLPVPVYLALGNHDLTTPDALNRWLTLAPDFFPDGKPESTIVTEDCLIHIVTNHWGDLPYYWKDVQDSQFSENQMTALEANLNQSSELPHLLLTHSPTFGLPLEQTGFAEHFHAPPSVFTQTVSKLAARHKQLKCVLGAHNHLNMAIERQGVHFVTVSSLVETPFEIKIFEITPSAITMATTSLATTDNLDCQYDFNKTFVQGRGMDRAFSRSL